jgi:ABC-type branched-subunit amino acid transport system substrate-binding protein
VDIGRRQFLGGGAAWLGLGAAGALAQTPRAAGKVRHFLVGQSAPLSGLASEIGLAYSAGARLYIDAFNARPAQQQDWQIDLKVLDDAYQPERAEANAQKLLADGADLLFGFVGAASGDAAARAAAKGGVPFFAPIATADNLRGAEHVFHVRPSLTDEAFKIVRHCATLNQDRVAVFAEDDALGRAGLAAVNEAVAELKLKPLVGAAFSPPDGSGVNAAVAELMKAQPQAVVLVSLYEATAGFIRAMRKAGYSGTFMCFSVVGIDPLFAALGKEIGGVVMSQVVPSPRSAAVPIVKEYLAATDNSDQYPSYEGLEGFIAAKVLVESIRRAGGRNADRVALQKSLSAVTDADVGGFRVNLRADRRGSLRKIDLVSITGDGKVVR